MKKLMIGLLASLVVSAPALADPVDNNVPNLFTKAKALIDSADARGGVLFNMKNETVQGFTSARLLSKDYKGYKFDLTLGYAVDKAVIAGVETDVLAGLARPTGSDMQIGWLNLNAGYGVGYSVEDSGGVHGFILDASVDF